MDSEREPPSAAEIFDDLIHASSSEGFTYPSFARCHRAGNVSECQGCRVGSCGSEQIFGSLDLSSNYEVISVGATKKWTQKAQRLKKGGQGFCEGRIQARSWRVLNSEHHPLLLFQVDKLLFLCDCIMELDWNIHGGRTNWPVLGVMLFQGTGLAACQFAKLRTSNLGLGLVLGKQDTCTQHVPVLIYKVMWQDIADNALFMVAGYRFDFLSRANPIQVEEISYRLWCQNVFDLSFSLWLQMCFICVCYKALMFLLMLTLEHSIDGKNESDLEQWYWT